MPHKLTERDHLNISCPWLQHLLQHLLPLEATSAPELFIGSFMKWVSMAEELYTSLRSPCTMPNAGWSVVKLDIIVHQSSGNAFSGVRVEAVIVAKG